MFPSVRLRAWVVPLRCDETPRDESGAVAFDAKNKIHENKVLGFMVYLWIE